MPTKTHRAAVSLYQQPGSAVWWTYFRVGGKRHRVSTGERDRDAAEAAALRLREAVLTSAGRPGRGEGHDLAELGGLDAERAAAGGVGERQKESIEACWGHVVDVLGAQTDPKTVTFDTLETYIATRRRAGARGQSIRKEVQALVRGLRIARRRGWLAELPEVPPIRSDPPRAYQRGHLHDDEQLLRWLEVLERDPRAKGARAQAEVVIRTGLRAEEVRRLTWRWVEAAPQGAGVPAVLRVPAEAAKTRTERVLGLTPRVLEILEAARQERGWDEPLLPGMHHRAFIAAAKTVGLPSVTLRDLRHCHATWAAQGTGDAAAAQAALGHADLATTQRYMSTTIARVAGAALAVDQVLERDVHSPRPYPSPECNKGSDEGALETSDFQDRGGRIRTGDHLLPKQEAAVIEHLKTCLKCRFTILDVLSICTDFGGCVHSDVHSRGVA